MSTEGNIRFIAPDGTIKDSYKNSDSYPSYLGLVVLRYLRDTIAAGNEADIVRGAERLQVVTEKDPPPSAGTRLMLARFFRNVGAEEEIWYKLLRETQGHPDLIFEAGITWDQEWEQYYNYIIDTQNRRFSYRNVARATWSWDALPSDEQFKEVLTNLEEWS